VIRLRSLIKRAPLLDSLYGQVRQRLGPGHLREYAIAIYHGDTPWSIRPLTNSAGPVLTRHHVSDVPAAFVADPFILRRDERWYLFFEVMRADTHRGEIAVATSPDGINWTYEQVVLAEPFHLSYPYVFEVDGEVFMVPETREARSVRLYRADAFPHGWSLVGDLLTGEPYADASLFEHEDRWWMFVEVGATAEVSDASGTNDVLRLYFAERPEGPWTEHPASPVVQRDPRIARAAGRVVIEDGKPIRFAQDCSSTYGRQVFAFAVESLTVDTYRERPLGDGPVVGPGREEWNRNGMHHVDVHRVDGRYVAAVDGWTVRLPFQTAGQVRRVPRGWRWGVRATGGSG
jgi:hypothetical protein